jgi:CBS domain-containing protein
MRRLFEIVQSQHPVTLPPDTTVEAACKHMNERSFASVLVVDDASSLLGIFTRRDVVRSLAEGKDPTTTKLDEVMTRDPATMPPDATAVEALHLMWDGGFRHVPLTQYGKVVGVVSHGDFRADEYEGLDAQRDLWEHMR